MDKFPVELFDGVIHREISKNRDKKLHIDHFDNILKIEWPNYEEPEFNEKTRSPRWYLRIRLREMAKEGLIANPELEFYSYPKDQDNNTYLDPRDTWHVFRKNAKKAIKNRMEFISLNPKWGKVIVTDFRLKGKLECIDFEWIKGGKKKLDEFHEDHFKEAITKLNTNAGICQRPRKRIARNILLAGLVERIEFDENNFVKVRPESIPENSNDYSVDPSESNDTNDNEDFDFDPEEAKEGVKKKANKPGVVREGARQFRNKILENYGNRCGITGSLLGDVIQAAHIIAYTGPTSNHVKNGIALRSDVHRLFDLGKIRINPEDLHIYLHPDIKLEYRGICSEKLLLPSGSIRPSKDALEVMWDLEKNRWF